MKKKPTDERQAAQQLVSDGRALLAAAVRATLRKIEADGPDVSASLVGAAARLCDLLQVAEGVAADAGAAPSQEALRKALKDLDADEARAAGLPYDSGRFER